MPLLDHRHFNDVLYLGLQTRETAYGVPLTDWNATTSTLIPWLASDAVHEIFDDEVVGTDLVRLGHTVSQDQVLVRQSVRIPFRMPYVTPNILAGIVGLAMGHVTTAQQPLLTAYEHTLTLAEPILVPSISAQIGHLANLYWIYPGIKADGWTLANNGAYLSLTAPLIGSGARTDSTASLRLAAVLLTLGVPPDYHIVRDELDGTWYLWIDSLGRLVTDTAPPAGTGLDMDRGIILAAQGIRYRLSVAASGSVTVEALEAGPLHVVEACALRDSTDVTWYLWIDASVTPTVDTALPTVLPPPLAESWLRSGDGQVWILDVTDTPFVPTAPPALVIVLLTLGVPPEYHLITDSATTVWSLAVTPLGALTVLASPPAGVGLEVGSGLTLLAPDGIRYRLGVTPLQSVQVTPLSAPVLTSPQIVEVIALRDSTGTTWYVWITALGAVGVSQEQPPQPPTVLPGAAVQGQTNLGPNAITLSSRVVSLSVQQRNGLQVQEGYRLSTGAVRGNFYGGHPVLEVTLALEVTTAREGADLAGYFQQRRFALEWQVDSGVAIATAPLVNVTTGIAPEYHRITDSLGGIWYLSINPLGEVVIDTTPPAGVGAEMGAGITLLARDGAHYQIGIAPTGETLTTRTATPVRPGQTFEVCALRDPELTLWYLWTETAGEVTVAPAASLEASFIVPWRYGVTLLVPCLQWSALVRRDENQCDILQLTGTALDDGVNEPWFVKVYNAQSGYLG